MKIRYPRLLVLGIRLEFFVNSLAKHAEKIASRLDHWLTAAAIVAVVLATISLYAADSVMCAVGRGDCTVTNGTLGKWLYSKK